MRLALQNVEREEQGILNKVGDDYIWREKMRVMKRLIFITVLMLGGVMVSRAQDIITTRSGEDIQAKVEEVSPLMIKYKRFSNLDGPTYSVSTAQILMIQYENGEKETFEGIPVSQVMKYRDLKHIYDSQLYIRQFDDKYSPGWLGFASFVIPGLGQAIGGEGWRAAGFAAGNIILNVIASTGVHIHYSGNVNGTINESVNIDTYAILCSLAGLGLNIWSICDAVRIAKVKNMYYQDLRAQRGWSSVDVKLEPFVASVPSPVKQGFSPSAGLSLKISFPN